MEVMTDLTHLFLKLASRLHVLVRKESDMGCLVPNGSSSRSVCGRL